jgi:acetyl-CoA C-acetyltransferase
MTPGKPMGSFAEDSASTYQFTREAQDAYALESLTRASAAIASGAFKAEITPVEVQGRKGVVTSPRTNSPARPCRRRSPA